jgi:ribosome biogenesis GTPase
LPLQNTLRTGLIVREMSGFFWVETEDGKETRCRLRGRLLEQAQSSDVAAIGDHVTFSPIEQDESGDLGLIEAVDERERVFSRAVRTVGSRGAGEATYQRVIIVNPDSVYVVTSASQPAPDLPLIDRILVAAEQAEIDDIVLVVNKTDLASSPDEPHKIFDRYEAMGYTVMYTSAANHVGVESIRERLNGRVSVFTGASGVGKSSLLNQIKPGLGRTTKNTSNWNDEGVHATRDSLMVKLGEATYLADTPGMRNFMPYDIEPEELDSYFRDLRAYVGRCRFRDCSHREEPGCTVNQAIKTGKLSRARLRSYQALRAELEALLEVY